MQHTGANGSPHSPFDRGDAQLQALLAASSFVALADGWVAAVERDVTVHYLRQRRLAPSISEETIARRFDQSVERLKKQASADWIMEALRPVGRHRVALDVIRLSEQVAAADGFIHPSEVQVIRLLRLITMCFEARC